MKHDSEIFPYYVYRHRRLDNRMPFYIGIGTKNTDRGEKQMYARAYSKHGRNQCWHGVVDKYGFMVEILMEFKTREECANKEKEFIKLYGRRNGNTGNAGLLTNWTEGGEDINIVPKKKESIEKHRRKMIGYKHSEQHKMNKKKSALKYCDRVICIQTGQVFLCAMDAAREMFNGTRIQTAQIAIVKACNGKRPSYKGFNFYYLNEGGLPRVTEYTPNRPRRNKLSSEGYKEISQLKRSGLSSAHISKMYNISPSYVNEIYKNNY